MTSIVIPFITGPDNSLELRQALRSMEQNLKFEFHPYIFSHNKPNWLRDEYFVFLPHRGGFDAKFKDQLNKIYTACKMDEISYEFIYSYDDVFFLNPISLDKLSVKRAKQDLAKKPNWYNTSDAQPNWKKVMEKTLTTLQEKRLPIFDYETHLPRRFCKPVCLDLNNEYNFIENAFQFSTLYFNHISTPHVILSKYDFYKLGIYQPRTYNYIMRLAKRYKILNYSEVAYNQDMKKAICDLFPYKSRFEV